LAHPEITLTQATEGQLNDPSMIEIVIGAPNPRFHILQYGNTEFCSGANRNFYRAGA
jgi:hypothetical protein